MVNGWLYEETDGLQIAREVDRPSLNKPLKGKRAKKAMLVLKKPMGCAHDVAELPPGWSFEYKVRKTGDSKGSKDRYIVSDTGRTFRSLREAGLK